MASTANRKWWNPGTWFMATVDSVTGAWASINPFGWGTAAGVKVTPAKVMGLPVYWACMRVLADSAASLPLKVFADENGRAKPRSGSEHYMRRVRRPNTYVSLREFIKFIVVNLLQAGNAFAMIERNTHGEPVQIVPVMWELVSIEQLEDGTIIYMVTMPDGVQTIIPYENMMHFKIFSKNGIVGIDPLTTLREAYGLAIVARDWASAFMKAGGWTGGYVIYDQFMNKEQQEQIAAQIPNMKRENMEENGKMALLQGGPKIEKLGISPKDSQFIEGRQFSDEEISGCTGVPLWLINRMRSGSYVGNGLEQQIIAFVMFGLNPYLQIIEDEYNHKIMPKEGDVYVEFNRNALMQMDSAARAAYFKSALGGSGSSGWMTIEEVREKENLPELEGEQYQQVSVWQFGNDGAGDESTSNLEDDATTAPAPGQEKATGNLQQEALNGAQVTALQGIVMAYAANQLTRETAQALISVAFPLIEESEITAMLSNTIKPTQGG